MNTHVRLVSSEDTNDDVDLHGPDERVGARDDEPIGLPEEKIPSRSNVLGETPPPLVVEREDRLAGARSDKVKSKTAFAKLFSAGVVPKGQAINAARRRGDRARTKRRRPRVCEIGYRGRWDRH